METLNINGVSPEFWLRLGYIMGCQKDQICIGICSDGEELSRLAADTIKIGAKCAGAKVYYFGEQNLPIMRSAVRFYKTDLSTYISLSKEEKCINIDILDDNGIQIFLNSLSDTDKLSSSNSFKYRNIDRIGSETDLLEFKTYYMRNIINSVRSEHFNINMCLSTKSKTVSEIIETVLKELYSKLKPEARRIYEFSGSISDDGEIITLIKSDGTELSREQTISIITYVLLKDSTLRTFILPEFISESAETAILKMGGNVIRSGNSDSEIMKKIVTSGGEEQMMMMYDGIYAAVRILDFLNRYDISFDNLYTHLPQIFKTEAEIECSPEKSSDIINMLKRQYKNNCELIKKENINNGIKIQTNGGIAVIFTPSENNVIKIVSESQSMETADEISTLFKNKIKMLAKS